MSNPLRNYRESLNLLGKRLVASRFLRWWLGELAGLVPAQLRAAGLDVGNDVLVALDVRGVVLSRIENGSARELGRLDLKPLEPNGQRSSFLGALDKMRPGLREVVLVLPRERVLRKTLTLPLAVEENLRQVLEFQMEQLTPFSPGQVYFGYGPAKRNFERNQLEIEFVVTPREAVDEAMKMLAGWGAAVKAVVAEEMLAEGRSVNVLPVGQTRSVSPLLLGVSPWLGGLIMLLAVAALAIPIVIKREAVTELMPLVERGKKAAEATDAVRRDLERRVEEYNFLLEKKQSLPPVVALLEELSHLLPDDTWVQQLDIKGKELQIQGETGSSSKLIGLFEQSPMFHDASFQSPLTKTPTSERYQLGVQVKSPATPLAAKPDVKPMSEPASGPIDSQMQPAAVPVGKDKAAGALSQGKDPMATEPRSIPPKLEPKP